MKVRTDIDGLLAVSNDKDTYAIVLATSPDYELSKADGFAIMVVTVNGDIQSINFQLSLQDALRNFIELLDQVID